MAATLTGSAISMLSRWRSFQTWWSNICRRNFYQTICHWILSVARQRFPIFPPLLVYISPSWCHRGLISLANYGFVPPSGTTSQATSPPLRIENALTFSSKHRIAVKNAAVYFGWGQRPNIVWPLPCNKVRWVTYGFAPVIYCWIMLNHVCTTNTEITTALWSVKRGSRHTPPSPTNTHNVFIDLGLGGKKNTYGVYFFYAL